MITGKPPYLGFGLGLRPQHYDEILDGNPAIDWFEVISENYMIEGGQPLYMLDRIRERYPIVMHGVSLSIAGPNHFHASVHTQGAAPSVDLRQFGRLDDGLYHYQLNAATGEPVKSNARLDNGRGYRERGEMRRSVAASGVFWVKNGAIVQHDRNAGEDMKRPQ